jgi:zinc/manganese transport system permease protein
VNLLLSYLDILLPALLAGILVLSTHVLMGQEVLKRGIIFLDLAIAQTAALGIVIAASLGLVSAHFSLSEWPAQLTAMGAAVCVASALYFVRHFDARYQEALIGILFVLASTGSYLLLNENAHGTERLKTVLVGQILWVNEKQLIFTAIVYTLVLSVFLRFRQALNGFLFYPLFALTVTVSTQLVGVYLVFASLIVPALLASFFRHSWLIGFFTGLLAYVIGLVCSSIFDLPTGPLITWCLVITAMLVFCLFKLFKKSEL